MLWWWYLSEWGAVRGGGGDVSEWRVGERLLAASCCNDL